MVDRLEITRYNILKSLDMLSFFLALLITLIVYHHPFQTVYLAIACMQMLMVAPVFSLCGTYSTDLIGRILPRVVRLVLGWAIIFTLTLAVTFFWSIDAMPTEDSWFFWALSSLFLLLAFRALAFWTFTFYHKKHKKTAIIAGAGELALKLMAALEKSHYNSLQLLGMFDDDTSRSSNVIGHIDELPGFVCKHAVDEVYIALPMQAEERVRELVYQLQNTTASVYFVPDLFMFDVFSNASAFQCCDINILALNKNRIDRGFEILKRVEDILLSGFILILISPLMLIIGLLIKAGSPGPVFFRQYRYGLKGEKILVWKFRSMYVCEDDEVVTQARQNGDSRITPLGKILRRYSLDELPQFFNVLQGSMSIVGPRPHAVIHNEEYRKLIWGYMWRHRVKPGITGWAQINGWRGETDELYKMGKRVEYDLWYIQNWTLLLDLKIIWLTITREIISRSNNAY